MSSSRLQQLLTFLNESPQDSFILFAIAKEYENLSDDSKALEYYLTLTKTSPNYVGTYYHLGKLYERQNEISKAFFTYKEGIKIARQENDQHAASELAGAKLMLGDDDDFMS